MAIKNVLASSEIVDRPVEMHLLENVFAQQWATAESRPGHGVECKVRWNSITRVNLQLKTACEAIIKPLELN